MHDLAVYDGTVVTARGRRRAHLYVEGGSIVAISSDKREARQAIDATGLHVLPGAIDGHVHFQDPGDTSREDFITGSSAAAVGGVTTVIEHTHSDPVRSVEFLREKIEHVRRRSVVDFGLAAHAWPSQVGQHRDLCQAGVMFFKVFTCNTHGVPGFDSAQLIGLFREFAGLGALCLVHSEDDAMLADNEHALRAAGRMDPAVIPEWRTREAELTALNIVGLLARLTGVRAIAAHVSHPDAVDLLQRERALGARLSIETCPQYMYLFEDEILEHGGLRKFTPPARARSRSDADAMWRLVSSGPVTHISTDHAPATRAQKTDGSIWDVHFGLPGVETTYSLLLNAALDGRLSVERVVELVAENPARLYGQAPRKGRLEPGADADLVLVDLAGERTLEDAGVVSKAGWTPYAGWRLKGRILKTFARGRLVAEDGKPTGDPPAGQFLPGPGASR